MTAQDGSSWRGKLIAGLENKAKRRLEKEEQRRKATAQLDVHTPITSHSASLSEHFKDALS